MITVFGDSGSDPEGEGGVILCGSLSLRSHLGCGCVTLQFWYLVLAESTYRDCRYFVYGVCC